MKSNIWGKIFLLLCGISCLLYANGAEAVPLGSVSFNETFNSFNTTSCYFDLSFTDFEIYQNQETPPGTGSHYFLLSFDPIFQTNSADTLIGQSFTVTSANLWFFVSLVDFVLTDGNPEVLAFTMVFFDHFRDIHWNFKSGYNGNGIDFAGYLIHGITTTIDAAELVSSQMDPFWNLSWTVTVDGEAAPVPEPATLLLLGSGLAGLVGLGRKKYKKK